jgi:hypothetical protein
VVAIDWNDLKVPFTGGKPIESGKPIENSCPEIMNYANNEVLKKFMYND